MNAEPNNASLVFGESEKPEVVFTDVDEQGNKIEYVNTQTDASENIHKAAHALAMLRRLRKRAVRVAENQRALKGRVAKRHRKEKLAKASRKRNRG